MKVYVCYKLWDNEGCSVPLIVFDSREKAEDWVKLNNKPCSSEDCDFEELEVQ